MGWDGDLPNPGSAHGISLVPNTNSFPSPFKLPASLPTPSLVCNAPICLSQRTFPMSPSTSISISAATLDSLLQTGKPCSCLVDFAHAWCSKQITILQLDVLALLHPHLGVHDLKMTSQRPQKVNQPSLWPTLQNPIYKLLFLLSLHCRKQQYLITTGQLIHQN